MISVGGNMVEKLRVLHETPIATLGTSYIPLPNIPPNVYKAKLYFISNNNGQVSYNALLTGGVPYNSRVEIPLNQFEIPLVKIRSTTTTTFKVIYYGI